MGGEEVYSTFLSETAIAAYDEGVVVEDVANVSTSGASTEVTLLPSRPF